LTKNRLYTFIVDFRGGTYCSQIVAKDIDDAPTKWIEKLQVEKKEIKYLGPKIIEQLKREIKDVDNKPTCLTGLDNIWFSLYSTTNGSFWVNIVLTER
jgi:hypothetical protein